MIRLITCGLGLAGFGVIIAEVINNAQLLEHRIQPYAVVTVILVIYASHELLETRIKKKSTSPVGLDRKDKILIAVYDVIYGLLGILVLLGIPYLWWGVIKRLAMLANQGKSPF
ncbi:MAG: hypothetical protein ACYS0I_17890 [Planctomycetota bacterium]|jgi:hypothetical protein